MDVRYSLTFSFLYKKSIFFQKFTLDFTKNYISKGVLKIIIMINNLGIIGLGQLGGSLLYQLEATKGLCQKIIISTQNQDTINYVLKNNLAQEAGSIGDVLQQCDFVIFATPIKVLNLLISQYVNDIQPNCIITDMTSVMGSPVEANTSIVDEKGAIFISSHPMAGNETVGFSNSIKDNLYEGKKIFVTPHNNRGATEKVLAFWQKLKATTIEIGAKEHDQIVAKSSHLLHTLSSLVTQTNLKSDSELDWGACAGAFRDFSRISSSLPEMWLDIFQENKSSLIEAVENFVVLLNEFKETLVNEDWETVTNELELSKQLHQKWLKK